MGSGNVLCLFFFRVPHSTLRRDDEPQGAQPSSQRTLLAPGAKGDCRAEPALVLGYQLPAHLREGRVKAIAIVSILLILSDIFTHFCSKQFWVIFFETKALLVGDMSRNLSIPKADRQY